MENQININELLEELREKADLKRYPKDVEAFKPQILDKEEDDYDFYLPYLERDIKYLNQNYYIDYNQPITGKLKGIKRFIKRLYRFHFEPLFDKQNDFNTETVFALNQLRSFVLEQEEENRQLKKRIIELENEFSSKKEDERLEERIQ